MTRFNEIRFAVLIGTALLMIESSLLALGANDAFAQEDEVVDFSSIYTGVPASPSQPTVVGDSSIAQVFHQNPASTQVDILGEVSALRTQLRQQERQIAQLRSGNVSWNTDAPRWFANYENVLVAPMQDNSTGVIVETNTGYSHVGFPWEINYSPRVQFGLEAAGDALGWRVRFWQFDNSESFQANDANGLIPIGNEGVVGYLSEDGDVTTGIAFIQEGTFTSEIRTDVIDFELQKKLSAPIDVYTGIRYAKVAQHYSAVTDRGNANATSEFRGIGPTAAAMLTHRLPYESFLLFANVRGSMLFGGKSYTVIDNVNNLSQTVGGIDLRSGSDTADTLAGNAEMQLGLRFAPNQHFNISVAIEAQHFANVGGPNPSGVFTGPDSGLNGGTPIDDDLGFLGLTVGTEVRW